MSQSSTRMSINLRSKGLRNASGSVIKGCVKDATTKLSIGSIPSNYQTIIYHSQSFKAFGTSQKRFYQQSKAVIQKSNTLNDSILSEKSPHENPSYSKKGYGPLIAKEQRLWIDKKETPGPGKYCCPESAPNQVKKFKEKLFKSLSKKQNIKPAESTSKVQTPGPSEYYFLEQRNANNGWKSSFKTKVNRNAYIGNSENPGPGYYDVKLIKQAKSILKQSNEVFDKKNTNNLLGVFDHETNDGVPGPGSYQYEMPTFKPLYERIKISGNFMLSKKDRFNNEIDQVPLEQISPEAPNFYSYNLKSCFDEEVRLIKWPAFMSESKRMVFNGDKRLGPSLVSPNLQNRKNFHFNIKGVWF